jgi:hypothetical protein
MFFKDQADSCRRQANEFAGRPEAPFLLSVARAFDELAISGEPAEARKSRPFATKIHA